LQLKIKFLINCPDSICVNADRFWIRQVFFNLISNAFRYTPEEGVISISVLSQEDARVMIEVKDTGHGIPENEQSKLFQKFSQLYGERVGTGLGLYIVKHIINSHDSDIKVVSSSGKGTAFYFGLPKSSSTSCAA